MTTTMTFATAGAKRRIAAMLSQLSSGPTSADDIATAMNITRNAVSWYLRHMEDEGLAICTRRTIATRDGALPSLFALAPGVEIPSAPAPVVIKDTDCGPGSSRTVTVSKSWPAIAIPKQSIFAALGL